MMSRLLKVRCREMFLGGKNWFEEASPSDFFPVQPHVPTRGVVNSLFNFLTPPADSVSVLDPGVGESVPDPVGFLRENAAQFSVYTLDFTQRVVGLVRVAEGIDIRKAPFMYQAQRENTEELLLLPFDVLPAVADALTEVQSTVKNIFLHNTGRCGSTIMSKAMDVVDQVQVVSEPDLFTVIFAHACSRDTPLTLAEQEEAVTVLRCVTVLLNVFLVLNDPSKTVICYKPRSQAIFIADIIQRAVPEAKTVFMYRDLPGYYDSWQSITFSGRYWRYYFLTALRIDSFLLYLIRNHTLVKFFREHPRAVAHGILSFLVSMWVIHMQKAYDLIQHDPANFFQACLSYKQLLEHKEQMILKVLEQLHVDLPLDFDSSKIREVFDVDSQEGTQLQSARGSGENTLSSWVGTWEKDLFSTVLEHFDGDIDEPDFVMPNTVMIT